MDKCVDCKKIKELSSEVLDLKIDFWVSMVIIILISISLKYFKSKYL